MGGQDIERPKRKAIPVRVKKEACERQRYVCARCGSHPVSWKPKTGTKFDHEPAIRLRDISTDGKDYDPPQLSAAHIDALCADCHHTKTNGTGATTAGTDTGKIKKERKRNKASRPKRAWPQGQKLRSGGFTKVHRPMRGR